MQSQLIPLIEESIRTHWDQPALSDYQGETHAYKDIARRIVKMHIIFEECGLKKGDKIAICGRNSAGWGTVFLATLTYGAVAVPILHDFKPDNIHHIVNHSEARLLFVGEYVWETLNEGEMRNLEAIIRMSDFEILFSKDKKIKRVREQLNELFGKKYPRNFRPEHLSFAQPKAKDLALINYTSGTTGFSKGVMLSYQSIESNVIFAMDVMPELQAGDNVVSMLPMAHMYGLAFEFLFELVRGCHVHFLTRTPSPKIILEAFATIKPRLIIAVPLIIEKIYKNKLQPILQKPFIKMIMKLPVIDQRVGKKICEQLNLAFGDNFIQVIIGGAALNQEAEILLKKIGFRYTIGYGMTECGPIISYAPWNENRIFSCGKAAPRMEIMIDSEDPQHIVGEILTKGDNVMMGYYKNKEASKEVLDKKGWLHTGDMGLLDKDGYLFIKGRCKNMILGASGQNIYPEEIEDRINNMPYVNESLLIDHSGKLTALIYPDLEQLNKDHITAEKAMEENRVALNALLPSYCQIAKVKIYPEEFEKTPKRSIKRFMYQMPKE